MANLRYKIENIMFLYGQTTIGIIIDDNKNDVNYYRDLFINKRINKSIIIKQVDGFISNHDLYKMNLFLLTDKKELNNLTIGQFIDIS